jgi:dTDP-4-amino-4,6-dideoxygalactose transaminase
MNEHRIQNAKYLIEGLSKYPFVSFPPYKEDRTCVFWFFPLMLSPEAAGFGHIPDADFRDRVSDALTAEGLRIGSWQRLPLPSQSIFKDKVGYGKGSPWTDSHYKGNVTYNAEDYPIAKKICDSTTWLSNMYFWPSDKNDLDHALAAFDKVFTNLDKLF